MPLHDTAPPVDGDRSWARILGLAPISGVWVLIIEPDDHSVCQEKHKRAYIIGRKTKRRLIPQSNQIRPAHLDE